MNPAYLETFRRHRRVFLLPLVLGAALALWANLAAPKLYRSSTALWSESSGGSASETLGAPPPAAQDQSMLNELLTTRYFRNNLAERSPLAKYLGEHRSDGWGPTALLAKLKPPKTEDDRIALALNSKRVTSSVDGPHVLRINFDAESPTLSVATLRVLVQEFRKQRSALRRDALAVSQTQVAAAAKTLLTVRTDLGNYRREHPSTNTSSDPQLRALAAAERNAVEQLSGVTDALNQATTAVLNGAAVGTTLRVVDAPKLPTGPSTGKKRLAKALLAGLFAGALMSILGIVGLTKAGRSWRIEDGDEEDDEDVGPDAAPVTDGQLADRRDRSEQTRLENAE